MNLIHCFMLDLSQHEAFNSFLGVIYKFDYILNKSL